MLETYFVTDDPGNFFEIYQWQMDFFTKSIDNQHHDMQKLRTKVWTQHALIDNQKSLIDNQRVLIESLNHEHQRYLDEIDDLKQKFSEMKGTFKMDQVVI